MLRGGNNIMQEKILFSFVIISKNEELNIIECIDSISELNNTKYKDNYEVIIVDSNSCDNTREKVINYNKIKLISLYNIKTSTQYSAALGRYIGTQKASGEYIIFLDGDMKFDVNFLSEALNVFMSCKSVGGVIGIRNDLYYNLDKSNLIAIKENVYNITIKKECTHFGGAIMFKRELLNLVGGYDPNILASEEPELYLRIKSHNSFKIYEIPTHMIDHNILKNENVSLFKSIISKRSIGLGQTFYKSILNGNLKTLLSHKPLSMFFIPFINLSLLLISILITFFHINIGIFLVYFFCFTWIINILISKNYKKSIYVIFNFFTIIKGIFSYRTVKYEVEKIK